MPYIERDESGAIVCLYGALAPMFQQARNYLSTDKLQERLDEYPAVHEEAARLGLSFDDAVADICSRWPEWVDDADLHNPDQPAQDDKAQDESGGDAVSEQVHSDDIPSDDVGDTVDADLIDSGDLWSVPEADPDAGVSGAVDSGPEPVADLVAMADEPEPETVAYPGMMVTGDPLKAAKNDAREALAQKQRSILDQYPWQDNLRDFDQLQSVRWAIAEGSHPPFNDEQQAEFDSLSTFSNWFGRVNQNAFNITVQIDDAQTVEAVQAIELDEGWPE